MSSSEPATAAVDDAATATTSKPLTALDHATTALQKFKWLTLKDSMSLLLRTTPSDLVQRLDIGTEILKETISCQDSVGSMNHDFHHELFKLANHVLTLMLRAVEETWNIKAHTLGLNKWKLPEVSLKPEKRKRPKNKEAQRWRRWAIMNQLDFLSHDFSETMGLDAGRTAIVLCLCYHTTLTVAKFAGPGREVIQLDKIGFRDEKEKEEWRVDMGKCGLWAVAGFGLHLLYHFGEQRMAIGNDGFGVARWMDELRCG